MERSFSPSRSPGSARLQFGAVSQRLRSSSFKKPPEPLRRAFADCLSSSSSSHHGNPSTVASEAARTLRCVRENMEMEMRACEDIDEMGEDLTPQIPPLSFSLYDPFLLSHCSSCFRPLVNPPHFPPFLPYNNPHNSHSIPIHYCSPTCSISDSHRHLSSGESQLFLILQSQPTTWHGDTSDLRTALRLLLCFEELGLLSHHYDRICGLMSNREKLELEDEETGEILARVKEGGRLMSLARRMRNGDFEVEEEMKDDNLVEETVLCQVLTNAVEVQINERRSLGIAIYGPNFSWINHSCSPNAYRFSVSGPELEMNYDESKLRLIASGQETVLKTWVCDESKLNNGICGYGPSIIVRSVKPIKKGEEVCVSYTDLTQPKATRHSELWSKYRFNCCCWRCSASPPTYLDRVLQENAAAHLEESNTCSDDNLYGSETYKELIDCMDDIICQYLSVGNPESCCEKLESMLIRSHREEQPEEEASLPNFKLHPLHHLSLNAYITLASAYSICANNLLDIDSGTDDHIAEIVELRKTSTAYYFLLAGVNHHLFLSESSLIAIAAHYWISAGESLLNLIRNPMWNSSLNPQPPNSILSSLLGNRWTKCMLMDKLEMDLVSRQSQIRSRQVEFEEISKSFLGCISKILPPVWKFLIHGHRYFKYIKDPIDFSWLETTMNHNLKESQAIQGSTGMGSSYPGRSSCCCRCEAGEGIDEKKTSVLQLGVHCLLYGGYLATICYSRDCFLTDYVRNLLCSVRWISRGGDG